MEPKHAPGPAFTQAADATEAARQQQIAALSDQQRQAFEGLRRQQEANEESLRQTQERQEREQMPERMQRHLIQSRALHYRPAFHRHVLSPREHLHLGKIIEDHLAGRDNRANRMFEHQLETARRKAKSDIRRDQARERGAMRRAHQQERDEFLRQAERRRGKQQEKADTVRESAMDITQRRSARAFREAARDPSWTRAFERAAKAEEKRGAEQERGNRRDPPHELDRT